jgi:hypothetical protein
VGFEGETQPLVLPCSNRLQELARASGSRVELTIFDGKFSGEFCGSRPRESVALIPYVTVLLIDLIHHTSSQDTNPSVTPGGWNPDELDAVHRRRKKESLTTRVVLFTGLFFDAFPHEGDNYLWLASPSVIRSWALLFASRWAILISCLLTARFLLTRALGNRWVVTAIWQIKVIEVQQLIGAL